MITLIQARSTSTRLPGKWKTKLHGVMLLDRCWQACDLVSDQTVIIFPYGDDDLRAHCIQQNYLYREGPEDDVLTRFIQAASCFPHENWFARITADCSMISSSELFFMGDRAKSLGLDFISNCIVDQREGMEIEILSKKALRWLDGHAKANGHREHVTTYIKEHLADFSNARMHMLVHREPYLSEWLPAKLSIDDKLDAQHMKEVWRKWYSCEK